MNPSTPLRMLTIIGVVAVVIVVFAGIIKLKGCNKLPDTIAGTITVPSDSNFVPVENRTYQPASVPFLSKKTSGVKLPDGVSEKDVRKVTRVELASDGLQDPSQPPLGEKGRRTIDIIETKDGQVFVGKDSLIKSVSVITFEDPVFSFGLSYGLGLSAGLMKGEETSPLHLRFSPCGVISVMDWNVGGLKFKAPMGMVDLDGIGAGVQLQVYHDFYLGAVHEWGFNSGTQVKAMLNIMF